ncbi:hypothetical protein F1880_003105 [Penicillium rolfsii]|nr:hypothetical protein F1880_003105 [Penicillium rolfsii]
MRQGGIASYLAEVSSPLIEINLLGDLGVARQRVQNNHVALSVLQQSVVNDEAVLQTLVLGKVGEALLLHTSGVQNVGASNDLRSELLRFADKLTRGHKLLTDLLGQSQLLGATVLEITGESDGQASDGTKLLADSEQVQEGLSGVLNGTITTVDDWHSGELGSDCSAAWLRVAQDHGISVAAESAEGVLKSFALLGGRVLGGNGDGATTQTLHSRVEGGGSTSGRLNTALKDVKNTVALNSQAHLLRDGEEQVQVRASELVHGQNVLAAESRAGEHLRQRGRHLGGLGVQRRSELTDGRDSSIQSASTDVAAGGGLAVQGTLRADHGSGGFVHRRAGNDPVGRHVGTLDSVLGERTVKAGGLALEDNALDRATHHLTVEGRPDAIRALEQVRTVNLDLKRGIGLVMQLENLLGVVVETSSDVLHGQATIGDSAEEQRQRLSDTDLRRGLLASKLVGNAANGEDIDGAQVVPQGLLVISSGQGAAGREVILGQEQGEDGDIAGHHQALILAESNEVDVLLGSHAHDVNVAAVQASQQEDRGQISALSIGDQRLARGPDTEVVGHGGHLVDVARQVVEGDEERANLTSHLANLVRVVGGGSNGQVEVAVGLILGILLNNFQVAGLGDRALDTHGHHANHAETSGNGGLGDLLEVLGAEGGKAGNKGSNVDQAGQDHGTVAGLEVRGLDVQRVVTSNGLNQDLGVLDVSDQRSLVINGHTTSAVTLGHVVGRAAEAVAGRQVDVQVDQVVGQVLGQGILGLDVLLLAGQNLEVLDGDTVLLQEVGSTSSGEEVVVKLVQLLDGGQHLHLLLVGTNGEQNVTLGQTEASGEQSLEVGLVLVTTERSDLTSGSHLNTKNWISTRQTREGELGDLDTDVVLGDANGRIRLEGNVDHSLGGHLDQVDTHDLGDEGERTRSTHVTLDDLDVVVLSNKLDVVRTSDVQSVTDLASRLLNATDSLSAQILGRQDQGSVTGVNTGILNVLRNEVANHDTVAGDGIHLNLLGVLDVLGDDNRVLTRDIGSLVQCSWQHRKAQCAGLFNAGQLLPSGLINTNAVKHARELVTVLSAVNHLRGGTKDVDVQAVQRQSDVVGGLTTHGDDHAAGSLELVDIQDGLEVDVLEVQTISLVVIGTDGLRVVVNHDGLVALLAESTNGAHRAPIELDRGTDTVDTRSQNHYTMVVKLEIVLRGIVSEVEIVSHSREFGSDSIDLLDNGGDASLNTHAAHSQLVGAQELSELSVRETKLLGLTNHIDGHSGSIESRHGLAKVAQTLQAAQEPLINVGQLPDVVNTVAGSHGVGNGEQALIRGSLKLGLDRHESVSLVESQIVEVNRADGLLNSLLESATDTHDLTNRLHGRAKLSGNTSELLQIPARDLDHTVIKRGLKAGASRLGDRVLDLVQGDTQTQLSGNEGKRVTGSLGGQGRRTRQTGVDLDNAVLLGEGVQGVLNVTFTDNTKVANDIDSRRPQHVVILIRESLGRSNDNRVTSVDTEGIEVLHVADSDAVVLGVTDNLVLNLLPTLHTALNQNLGADGQSLGAELLQLLHVVGESTAKTTQGVGSTNNDWEANVLNDAERFLESRSRGRLGTLLIDRVHAASEKLTVLSGDDGINGGTQDLDTKAFKLILELNTDLKGGLTTEGDVNGIRTLVFDNLANKVGVHRKEVDLISQTLGGLNSGNVGVDQDGVDAFLLQRLDGLTTGVIELSSLADAQTTTAQNQNLLDVHTRGGLDVLSLDATGELDGLGQSLGGGESVHDGLDEDIEQVLGIPRTGGALRVELNTEEGAAGVTDTLVTGIVGVHKQLLPAVLEAGSIHGETVVLGSDVTLARQHAGARNVVATVTEQHLGGGSADGAGNQLVTETDTEDWCPGILQGLGQVVDSGGQGGGVTRTVGNEQTVVVLASQGGEIVVPGHDHDLDATGKQAAQLVIFHTNIQAQNPDGAARRVLEGHIGWGSVELGLTDGDWEKGCFLTLDTASDAIGLASLLQQHATQHTTLLTDTLGQRTGVHTVHGRDALLLEPLTQGGRGQEVGEVLARVGCHHQRCDVDLRGLKVCGELEQIIDLLPRGHTVVTHERESDDQDLAAVGGVGDGLGVTNHTRLEDQFTGHTLLRTKVVTLVDSAILQLEGNEPVSATPDGDRGRGDHSATNSIHCGLVLLVGIGHCTA